MASDMEFQFTYDEEATLGAPDGVTKTINVEVTLEPKDSGCLIYGRLSNGNIGCVGVRQSGVFDLPFVSNKVFVKHLHALTGLQIKTLGWEEDRIK
jgi:hypothetical protein